MEIHRLLDEYRTGNRTPVQTVEELFERIRTDKINAWITVRDEEAVLDDARSIQTEPQEELPLYGVPFAVKDNIDYAGVPTTAGCPAYAYDPDDHATVVERLVDAGAILVGKTNMDQFATGLVGTRSPHGACRNVYNEEYISGGSSSGSAVAVARGHVAFALGTDTAGSGRVPAAFNGLVGLKPTCGVLSTDGVVPACASLDCVSIFAHRTEDALRVESVAAGFDSTDPYSRHGANDLKTELREPTDVTIGVPSTGELEFFDDSEAEQLFDRACSRAGAEFGEPEVVDFTPFRETAELLYGGPWVAERLSAVGEFLDEHPDDTHPVVSQIIRGGSEYTAVDTFQAFHRLEELRRQAESVMDEIDVLLVPTTGTCYTIEEVHDEPFELNSNLGYYTNFVNLLDLSAVSVPSGSFEAGPTFGITVIGDAFEDSRVASIAAALREDPDTETSRPISGR